MQSERQPLGIQSTLEAQRELLFYLSFYFSLGTAGPSSLFFQFYLIPGLLLANFRY